MKRSLVVFLLALGGIPAVRAQAPAPAAPPSGVAQPGGAREIKFVNHSSFQAGGGPGRNPFLPIGYARVVPVAAKPAEMNVTAEMFVVTATMDRMAIINGKVRDLNTRIPLNQDGSEFVTVRRIDDGSVILDHRGRLITVQLGRKK